MVKISIIIPAYNAAKFIAATIESVLQQTWQNWELIIINDGSKDDTENVIQPYLKDSRIIYYKQSNAGCSGAKNTGLRMASGDYIQYLDADDILSADKIAEQVDALSKDPWAVAVCRTKIFSASIEEPDYSEIDTDFLYSTNKTLDFVLNLYGLHGRGGMIQPNAFLISRQLSDAVGLWDESLSPSPDEDGEYFCRVMLRASSIIFTPRGINYYRKIVSEQSLSKQITRRHVKGALRSLELKASHLLNIENSDRVKQVIARQYAGFIYSYCINFHDLTKVAEKKILQLGLKHIPAIGGRNFQRVSKIIGFKRALFFKKIIR